MLTNFSDASECVIQFYKELNKEKRLPDFIAEKIREDMSVIGIQKPLKMMEGVYFDLVGGHKIRPDDYEIAVVANLDKRAGAFFKLHDNIGKTFLKKLDKCAYGIQMMGFKLYKGISLEGKAILSAVMYQQSINSALKFDDEDGLGKYLVTAFKERYGIDRMFALYCQKKSQSNLKPTISEANFILDCYTKEWIK